MNCGCCSCSMNKIKTCFVCKDEIEDNVNRIHTWVQCVKCKIYMHTDCYDNAKDVTQPYTKCNACNGTGCIGTPFVNK
jgi:hypothetical protein